MSYEFAFKHTETLLKFYKILAVPMLLYGQCWTLTK